MLAAKKEITGRVMSLFSHHYKRQSLNVAFK